MCTKGRSTAQFYPKTEHFTVKPAKTVAKIARVNRVSLGKERQDLVSPSRIKNVMFEHSVG